jgi:hypothetical protein
MMHLIFLPTQGPHLPRPGAEEDFDWREQCRLAASLQRERSDAVIFVPSAFQQSGSPSELESYGARLRAEGVPEIAMRLEPRGLETVEQCELAIELAQRENARLVAVTCSVQLARVKYLLRHHDVEHIVAHGTPNAWLRVSNAILAIAFPIIDHLGLRPAWKRWTSRRRLQGKQ